MGGMEGSVRLPCTHLWTLRVTVVIPSFLKNYFFLGGGLQLLYFSAHFPMLCCDDVIQKPLSVTLTPSSLSPHGRKS